MRWLTSPWSLSLNDKDVSQNNCLCSAFVGHSLSICKFVWTFFQHLLICLGKGKGKTKAYLPEWPVCLAKSI